MASSKDRQRKLARAKLDRQMARRAVKERRNRRVLAGTMDPRSVAPDERGPVFAVLRSGEPAPVPFRLVYRNDAFALYRLASGGT